MTSFFEIKFSVQENEITAVLVREMNRYFEKNLCFHYEIRSHLIIQSVFISLLSQSENHAKKKTNSGLIWLFFPTDVNLYLEGLQTA